MLVFLPSWVLHYAVLGAMTTPSSRSRFEKSVRHRIASDQCAAPGRYIATMCGSRSTPDGGQFGRCSLNATPTCVSVPFDYPGPMVVEGMIR